MQNWNAFLDGLPYLPIKTNIIDVGAQMNIKKFLLLSNNTIHHVDSLDLGHSQDLMAFLHFLYIYSCNQGNKQHLVTFARVISTFFLSLQETEKISIVKFQECNCYKDTQMVQLIWYHFMVTTTNRVCK